jgi:hypothetical protein
MGYAYIHLNVPVCSYMSLHISVFPKISLGAKGLSVSEHLRFQYVELASQQKKSKKITATPKGSKCTPLRSISNGFFSRPKKKFQLEKIVDQKERIVNQDSSLKKNCPRKTKKMPTWKNVDQKKMSRRKNVIHTTFLTANFF